jgi:esterase/lipase
MKKTLIIILTLVAIGFVFYKSGPHPEKPDLNAEYSFNLPNGLDALEKTITEREALIPGIKEDNNAQFVWADSLKRKTRYAIVYIHGFSASHEEGAPIHENLAKRYGANLYKARLAGHGIDLGDATMADLNSDNYLKSAEEALEIGNKIGDKVILVATSAGGALSAYLASKHPEIAALVLYSPCIKIYDGTAELLDNPWGLTLAQMVQGKDYNDITPKNETQMKYWTMHYRLEGLVALQNFLTNAISPEVFAKVKCPVFMGYYYKDEEHQDKVVSVPAMLQMFEELGSKDKTKMAFPEVNNHVMASYVMSEDLDNVQSETINFLDRIIL